jgi:hypothetical protein
MKIVVCAAGKTTGVLIYHGEIYGESYLSDLIVKYFNIVDGSSI